MPTLVVTALAEEMRPLLRRTEVDGRETIDGLTVAWGTFAGARIVAATVGVGPRGARRAAATLLRRLDVERMLVLGISGGLSPGLSVGDLLVGTKVTLGLDPAPDPDSEWAARALALPGARAAWLATSEHVLATAASKAEAWRATGGHDPAAVDMETAGFAQAAAGRAVPYLAVRAVIDPAEADIPLDFARFRRPDGRLRSLPAALHALRHPGAIARLIELRRDLGVCAHRLVDAARELVVA